MRILNQLLDEVIAEYEKEIKESLVMNNNFIQEYKGKYIQKMNDTLNAGIRIADINLQEELKVYYESCPLYKLADKNDVEEVTNRTLQIVAAEHSYTQEDFASLVKLTDANDNYLMWQELTQFLTDCAK